MNTLSKEQKKLLTELEECAYFLKGSINDYCANCNRAKCICPTKTTLRSYRLTYKDEKQRTKVVYVPRERVNEVKKMILNYRKFQRVSQKLLLKNIQMFKAGP